MPTRDLIRKLGPAAALAVLSTASVPVAPVTAGEGWRIAPMTVEKAAAAGALALGDPRIEDSVVAEVPGQDGQGVYRVRQIEAFRFTVEQVPEGLGRVEAEVAIEPAVGEAVRWQASYEDLKRGDDLVIPAGYTVRRRMEGAYTARVAVRDGGGRSLFEGTYGFGYPRYHGSGPLERVHSAAIIRDDFESESVDERIWKVKPADPNLVRMAQTDGRFRIDVTGRVGHPGLVSVAEMDSRDVVLLCRTGIESRDGARHESLVHLCGSGRWSPDNWIEVQISDAGGGAAEAVLVVSVPPPFAGGAKGPLKLPHPAHDGYLVRIACEGATHLCRGSVQVDGGWLPVGDAFEIPARTARVEIKAQSWNGDVKSSTSWFDDCRAYPRPETHYVTVALRGTDRRPPGAPVPGHWITAGFNARNEKFTYGDVSLRLYAADGVTLVDETTVDGGMDVGLLRLTKAPWDTYPVPAVIRVLVKGEPIGPDHLIESRGVEGLYPDDVYTLILE